MTTRDELRLERIPLATRRDAMRSIGAAAILVAAPACGVRAQPRPQFTPEMFGARGDGITDDYEALSRLARAVSDARGGSVRFGAGRTYLIDRVQRIDAQRRNSNEHIRYNNCRGLAIDLNGSTISVKGDFHRGSVSRGSRRSDVRAIMPFMLNECVDVTIENGELNGNADKMTRDERVAESAGNGIAVNACRQVRLARLHIHHFSTDGIRLGTNRGGDPCEDVRLSEVRVTNNARQGLSNTGGIGVVAVDCEFSGSGRTGGSYRHAPQSGVDVEPFGETPRRSDFRAERCRFDDNIGYPVVAGNPDHTAFIELIDCSSRNRTQKRMILVAERCIVRGGTWHNVQIACAYAAHRRFRHSISVEVSGGTWTGDDRGWAPVYDLNDKHPQVHIHDNRFELRSPRPYTTTYLFQCSNPNHRFENNRIFVARTGHAGSGDDLVGNFQRTGLVRNNRWTTDAAAPQRFVNNYSGAGRVEGERFTGAFVGRGIA